MIEIKVKYKALTPISEDGKTQKLERKTVEKVISLKDLDQYSKEQRLLHMGIKTLTTVGADGNLRADLESYEQLANLGLKILFTETSEFSKKDLLEFESDGFAFANFAEEFVGLHVIPFFLNSKE